MTKLTSQLKKDYWELMQNFWPDKANHARRRTAVKEFLARHEKPPFVELEQWLAKKGVWGIWDTAVVRAHHNRVSTTAELEIMKLLLTAGLSPNFSEPTAGKVVESRGDAKAPLNIAVINNDMPLVKLYLAHDANPNTLHDGVPPLFVAVINNNLPLVKTLLRAGADPRLKITLGRQPGFGILAYLHRELSLISEINNICRDFHSENFNSFSDVKNMIKTLCRAGVSPNTKHGPQQKTLIQLLAAQKKKLSFSDYNNHEELSDPTHWSVLLTELSKQGARER